MPLVPHHHLCIDTDLSPEVILSRLRGEDVPYKGEILERSFYLRRVYAGRRGSLVILLNGEIEPREGHGSRLLMELGIGEFWVTVLLPMGLWMVLMGPYLYLTQAVPFAILIQMIPVMAAFVALIYVGSMIQFTLKVREARIYLCDLLQGQQSTRT